MLSTLEDYFLAVLRKVHPADLVITSGPPSPPGTSVRQLLSVTAMSLRLPRQTSAEEENNRRESAFFIQHLTLAADGRQLDLSLPAEATGQLVAVESPPGKIARPGDDYRLEGRLLRFYRAPEQAVVVQLRGERAGGYQEISPCLIAIELAAWAETVPQADSLLVPSVAAVLTSFVDLDVLELAQDEKIGIRLRLLKPVLRLSKMEHSAEQVAQARYIRSTARLRLRGELELTLVLGAPPAAGIIQAIEIQQQK